MLNFHIIKVVLKNGEARYRTILTKSGKGIKTKTFRRKQDARTWGNRAVLDAQEYEAKGIKPCTIKFSRLADEYMHWWTGKDHDRARLVLWWEHRLGKTLLSDITPELIRDTLKPKKSQAPATYNKHLAVLSAILDYATLQQEDDSILEQYSFRKTLVTLGQTLCQSPEEFKSWSQNLGHEDVLTTLYSYGHVQQHRQGEIFQQLKSPRPSTSQNADDIARAVIKAMAEKSSPIGI